MNVFTIFANDTASGRLESLTGGRYFSDGRPTRHERAQQCHSRPTLMHGASRSRQVHCGGLTIMRAHHLAGYSGTKDLKPLAGFSEWSRMVRAALIWLGKADPVNSLEVGRAEDPQWSSAANLRRSAIRDPRNCDGRAYGGANRGEERYRRGPKTSHLSRYINPRSGMDTVRLGLWFASFKDEVFD